MWTTSRIVIVCILAAAAACAAAGPYSRATDDATNPYDPPVPGFVDSQANPIFVAWASGYRDYLPAPPADPPFDTTEYLPRRGVAGQFQTPERALGPVTGDNTGIVSLGDLYQDQIDAAVAPGEITLTFDVTIRNGLGADLAVFENGFISDGGAGVAGEIFGELGYVEVSTNGVDFARFPSVSLTPEPVGFYGTIDATNVYNLPGKHANNADASGGYEDCFGTPFDFDDLLEHALVQSGLVDLGDINYVKIVDIPGSGDYTDSEGGPIYDSWPTWGSGGFDLDAVGVINVIADPLPGDLDADGFVGGLDLNIVLTAWGDAVTPGVWIEGDPSGDGYVRGEDLNIVLANWGAADATGQAQRPIPEPATVALLSAGAVLMLLRRKKRRTTPSPMSAPEPRPARLP